MAEDNQSGFEDEQEDPVIEILVTEWIESKVKWVLEEKLFRELKRIWETTNSYPLSVVLEYRLRRSMLCHFLYDWNSVQIQELDNQMQKFIMYEINTSKEKARIRNDLFDDLEKVLEDIVKKDDKGMVTKKQILRSINNLRITFNNVADIDGNWLKNLKKLKVLILSGNGLPMIEGKKLPSGLNHLELHSNRISDFDLLLEGLPPKMLYLGLGRNLISECHFDETRQMGYLLVLDLSDNNIKDLEILKPLAETTPSLTSLNLQGNPCAYEPSYCNAVVSNFKKLLFLDNVNLSNTAFQEIDAEIEPCMVINCYTISGIPQSKPEKHQNKKVIQTYHLEIECPLIDEGFRLKIQSKIKAGISLETNVYEEHEQVVEDTDKKKESKRRESKSESKNIKAKSNDRLGSEIIRMQELNNEILRNDRKLKGLSEIISDGITWTKNMEFKKPTLIAYPPKRNLQLLRDVFRSKLTIRLVNIKKIPGPKQKTPNKNKKEKGGTDEKEIAPSDIIIGKETLAKIPINLQTINWNNKMLYYTWDQTKPFEAVYTPDLMNKPDPAVPLGKEKKPKGKSPKEKKSNYLSLQLGIGIN